MTFKSTYALVHKPCKGHLNCPTNNALLINFQLSSDAEISLISTDWAYRSTSNVQKRVCNVSNWASIPFCIPPLVVGWVFFYSSFAATVNLVLPVPYLQNSYCFFIKDASPQGVVLSMSPGIAKRSSEWCERHLGPRHKSSSTVQ